MVKITIFNYCKKVPTAVEEKTQLSLSFPQQSLMVMTFLPNTLALFIGKKCL